MLLVAYVCSSLISVDFRHPVIPLSLRAVDSSGAGTRALSRLLLPSPERSIVDGNRVLALQAVCCYPGEAFGIEFAVEDGHN
jgi:hypothetical protein